MEFEFSPEHKQLRETVRRHAEEEMRRMSRRLTMRSVSRKHSSRDGASWV